MEIVAYAANILWSVEECFVAENSGE
jgi:hypothetical protein